MPQSFSASSGMASLAQLIITKATIMFSYPFHSDGRAGWSVRAGRTLINPVRFFVAAGTLTSTPVCRTPRCRRKGPTRLKEVCRRVAWKPCQGAGVRRGGKEALAPVKRYLQKGDGGDRDTIAGAR